MSNIVERFITIIVGAGIVGLFILNSSGTTAVLDSVGTNSVNLLKATQGR